MRIMNLPPFPGDAFRIGDLGEYLKARLALDTVPWPDHSLRLAERDLLGFLAVHREG
jgi:hypothetical protein